MFRLSFICEDKNLARIMHSLAGQAINLEVVPVAGTNPELAPTNGSGRNTGPRTPQLLRDDIVKAGGAPQMLVSIMRKHKLAEINAKKVKEFCLQMGLSTKSYSHLLRSATDHGLLKKAGKDPDNNNGFLWKLTDKAGDK